MIPPLFLDVEPHHRVLDMYVFLLGVEDLILSTNCAFQVRGAWFQDLSAAGEP